MSALPSTILLVDRWRPLTAAWSQAFGKLDRFEVLEGDFFARDADAMVSPANSFGIMDGGLDLATGIGAMDARRCAGQMRMAFDQAAKPARIPSYALIHELHHELRSIS